MNFETFFRLISYSAVFCGLLSLWVSGSFGIVVPLVFISVLIAAWILEDSKWQLSEKWGTALIVLALPAFIVGWRLGWLSIAEIDTAIAGVLARLILALSAIKLLQQKSSRDWVFLYLMSFFEVMLGAGLSISGLYLLSFLLYLLVMVCAIITFEIRKTAIVANRSPAVVAPNIQIPAGRLPVTSIVLIAFISSLAVPLFFMLPRVGGAGFGGGKNERTRSGFSETVTLGGTGEIQESDAIVMRVKLDKQSEHGNLYLRGIALDTFDNSAWRRSSVKELLEKGERDTIQIDNASSRENLSIQTVYLEPLLDTPVLFALPRAIVVQGNFSMLYKDLYGAISFPSTSERVSYKVLSDRSTPPPAKLRADHKPYSSQQNNYLQLPRTIDPRIGDLAERITAGSTNRYDQAKAIENYLQTSFGYTLQRRAGGSEPLADFLFNVREGHCEYFATAMAVMLRTQGIATRVVNGFHGGEYNDAADVTIVRERNAHAWVEVYFPSDNAWVLFDPTPAASLNALGLSDGLAGTFRKYADALETFWIQYFVAFDDQEQRSLARSVRSGMADFQVAGTVYLGIFKDIIGSWWAEVKGAEGGQARLTAIAKGIGVLFAVIFLCVLARWLFRWVLRWGIWQKLGRRFKAPAPGMVEFYEKMQEILAERGFHRKPFQTPVEFAASIEIPEVVRITEMYNGVRFGKQEISPGQFDEIDQWLRGIKSSEVAASSNR